MNFDYSYFNNKLKGYLLMKKIKLLSLLAIFGISSTAVYAADIQSGDPLSPVGYWVQYDEDNDAGKGMPEGIIQAYFAKNGTLEMKIVVPLMQVNNKTGQPGAPMIHCDVCGKGSINGFSYDYTSPSDNLVQGLAFAGNMQKQPGTDGAGKGFEYDKGGVLNPNDGKTYNSKAQPVDGGETLFARAYKGSGWYSVGKDAHWKRIDEATYEKVKKECGLTDDGVYPYQAKDGSIKNNDLYKKCTNYPFDVKKPV